MLTRILAATASVATLAIAIAPSALSQAPTFTSKQYAQTNLVSDLSGNAPVTDVNLRDAWGLSRSSTGDWWISDNVSGLSTLYSGTTGAITPLVVTIPTADANVNPNGSPTGTVFNGTGGFAIAPGKPALFLFATQDGTISGWNPGVNPTKAIITVKEKGSSYFGLTMATVEYNGVSSTYLYVADFGKKRIAVFDTNFKHVTEIERRIDSIEIPGGFAPFNIQNLGGNLYIAIVKKGADGNEVHQNGLGAVGVVTPDGRLVQIFETGSFFNAPWGLAIAPSDFGAYSHDVLVGNFGSGTILAFDPVTGKFKGKLEDKTGAPLVIPGLWALSVGNNTAAGGPATSVFFSAGPNNEQDGLFGSLTALSSPLGNDQ
jgi:uncharacterized protein (TIGR03118 family)